MKAIELELSKGAINVDATMVAEGLGLEPAAVLNALRNGEITASCEQGIAEDAGRFRLTFYRADKRLRFVLDREGRILERSTARLRRRELTPPAAAIMRC